MQHKAQRDPSKQVHLTIIYLCLTTTVENSPYIVSTLNYCYQQF